MVKRPCLAVFRNSQGAAREGAERGGEDLRGFFASLPVEQEKLDDPATTPFLAEEIARHIFKFLLREDAVVNMSQTPMSLGADSLVAIEIRNWWRQALGVEITIFELTNRAHTMEALAALAVERLKEKFLSS